MHIDPIIYINQNLPFSHGIHEKENNLYQKTIWAGKCNKSLFQHQNFIWKKKKKLQISTHLSLLIISIQFSFLIFRKLKQHKNKHLNFHSLLISLAFMSPFSPSYGFFFFFVSFYGFSLRPIMSHRECKKQKFKIRRRRRISEPWKWMIPEDSMWRGKSAFDWLSLSMVFWNVRLIKLGRMSVWVIWRKM
jgi:hypothetical protein